MQKSHYTWKVPFNTEPNAHYVHPHCADINPDGVFDLMFDTPAEAFEFLFSEQLVDYAVENNWHLVQVIDTEVMPITEFIDNKCILVVSNGDMFEGTLGMFKDNFFSNATFNEIYAWCRSFDPPVDFSWKMKVEPASVIETQDRDNPEMFIMGEQELSQKVHDALADMDGDEFARIAGEIFGWDCYAVSGYYECTPKK